MALTCEVCSRPITTTPSRIMIDGAVLLVCLPCSGRGANVVPTPPKPRPFIVRPPGVRENLDEPEFEVDPDYYIIVRQARERMNLTQEALGRSINEKPSVISHVESKKLKPDPILARKLMHHLKISLFVLESELESSRGR
jgi:putative transcription factor